MGNIKDVDIMALFRGEKYSYLLEEFEERKIKDRFRYLYEYLCAFIEENNLETKVYISIELLEQVVVDYFVDMYRLKKFHHIEISNNNKIHAFTAYWLANEKVLQIMPSDDGVDKRLTAVNAWMVTSYLVSYLFGENGKSIAINEKNFKVITEFKENLQYSLRYRQYTPYTLETILIAFSAGAGWQHSLDYKDEEESE
ncbi:hypothetical protein ACQRBN_04555 [Bariatricus sp. SGI.154]|uniref:hypothetical protein n=1 Tax=Bariatricus sp. SGI.154 TaxID=3420549 RepID=UPI003D03833B